MPLHYYPQSQIVENQVFDLDEMEWVAMTKQSTDLTTVRVQLTDVEDKLDDLLELLFEGASRLYQSGSYIYSCMAEAGALTSDPVWRISRLDTSSGMPVTKWADGNKNFDNVADNYATLTYI